MDKAMEAADFDAKAVEAFRTWYRLHTGKMITRANAARAILSFKSAEATPDPVAWRWRAKVSGEWGLWSVCEVDPNDWTWREYWQDLQVEPLYTASDIAVLRAKEGT